MRPSLSQIPLAQPSPDQSALGRRGTMADEIRERLADDIVFGRLEPGTRLDEQALADRYGVSRTPVREALKQLAATGLAEPRPRKGVVVTAIPPERLELIFEALAEMEASCARYASVRMTDTERRQLQDLHQLSHMAVDARDADRYDRLNMEFHAVILRGSHNSFLSDAAFSLRTRALPFRRAQFHKSAERLNQSLAEHIPIIDAILDGRGDDAFAAMRSHLAAASDASSRLLLP